MTPEALELSRPRSLGELISKTLELLQRHFAVFFSMTLLVVAPVVILLDGVWGRQLADGYDAHPSLGQQVARIAVSTLIEQPLITALHVTVVLGLARGVTPELGPALRDGLRAFGRAAPAIALSTAGILVGFVCLIVPGLWLSGRWYFSAQAAVVDDVGPREALRRSEGAVDGRWWSTVGRLLALALLGLALVAPLAVVRYIPGLRSHGLLYILSLVFSTAITASFAALSGTLLFFDRRAVARDGGDRPPPPLAPRPPAV